ncbi:hypothetical protein PaeBR_05775 [Paenibacillus sp. BR2-3]|uniref:hypothetical protein n=1 Tax=Paenibacillus sp. BR2-3 TaxID=3048494 RepID=UPI0039779BF4
MNFMPPAKSKRWFFWMIAYGLILWMLLGLHRIALLEQPIDLIILLRFALFAFVVSAILNGFGWLGARFIWLITTIGIIIGLGLMFMYTYRDMSGWEDLAGFLTFTVFMLGGFTAGLVVEGIYLVIRRQRRKQ